jgi:signal transduction histidine kinase
MNPTHSILLVDDESNVLCSIIRNLRGKPYLFRTARCGEEALHILKTQTIDLVVSDERMPGMQGSELVTWIANQMPEVVRIILTGQASLSAAIKAMNYGRVYRYLTKPIKTVELALTISQALEERDQARSQRNHLAEERTQFAAIKAENLRLLSEQNSLQEKCHSDQRFNREKITFLAAMTHELRSPLTAMLGSAELLAAANSTIAQDKLVNVIQRSGQHLLQLVNNSLDHAKLTAGKMELEWIPFRVADVVEEAYTQVVIAAQQKGLELAAVIAENVPTTIVADPTRLRQALINLLGNAVKFTSQGRVDLQVACLGGNPVQLEFAVRDTGPGMNKDEVERLFAPFVQANESTTRKFGGSGLGLHLSREIAHMMGGDLLVESFPDVGSVFRLSISPRPYQPTDTPEHLSPTERTSLNGKRVLLADDSLDNQRILNAMLFMAGVDVTVVDDGQQACEVYLNQPHDAPFDAILLDLDMPRCNGVEATERLREFGCRVPILALTASEPADVIDDCQAAGVDRILTKPISRERLLTALSLCVENVIS